MLIDTTHFQRNEEMRNFSAILCAAAIACCSNAFAAKQHLITAERQQQLTAEQVLTKLQKGNQRYVNGTNVVYNQKTLSKLAAQHGQAPLAFIFSCVDSRSIPEAVFDQPKGSLFVSRIAGNVIGPDVLGSMEFAAKYAGSKLVVIMGHTRCGAVAGSCSGVNTPPHLDGLLAKIKPAVDQYKQQNKGKVDCANMTDVDGIAKQNVLDQMQDLMKDCPALSEMVTSKQIMLVGAMHDLKTGKVSFFDINGKNI